MTTQDKIDILIKLINYADYAPYHNFANYKKDIIDAKQWLAELENEDIPKDYLNKSIINQQVIVESKTNNNG